ncbi:hypothetical protein GGR51DRAFT_564753 [Nemania sp. FL0031]|nr:hypothetical protein GGR51DRAFT_564753 [Nemania sp. FL0031]
MPKIPYNQTSPLPPLITPQSPTWSTAHPYATASISTLFHPQTTLVLTLLFKILIELSLFARELSLFLLVWVWNKSLAYPARLALIAFGWAMEPFQHEAVDLYLSVGLD